MNTAFNPKIDDTKSLEINSKISGYWKNDIWDIRKIASNNEKIIGRSYKARNF